MRLPELLIRPDLGKRAYRLKCRFAMPAYPLPTWVESEKYKMAERFVSDMAKQGWEYDPNRLAPSERGFRLRGPYATTPVSDIKAIGRSIVARRDLPRVLAGDPLRDTGEDFASIVPLLDETDKWEYEISAVFIRNTILVETPDSHEELEIIRN